MILRCTLLLSAALISISSKGQESGRPTCRAKTALPKDLIPETIASYIRVNQLQSVEDLTCCLANLPGLEIAIAHNSIAAQNGDYQNPRILLVKRGEPSESGSLKPIEAIFSINSGAGHLSQGHSVEMMANDPGSQSLVYNDIDFSKKPPMSKRNPEACLQCHGDSNKKVPWGARPIFEVTPWPRFVLPTTNSSRDVFGSNFCKHRSYFDASLARATLEAMDKNPRYSCVKNLPRISIDELDRGLSSLNDRRTARLLSSTKDFSKFKYALAATKCPNFNPAEFIPQKTLATMTNQDSIPPALRNMSTPAEMVEFHDNERLKLRQHADVRDEQKANIRELIKERKPIKLGDELADSHFCTVGGSSLVTFKSNPGSVEGIFSGENVILHRYRIASKTGAFGTGALSGDIRFLFESRGIDLSGLGMAPTGGTYHRPIEVVSLLKRIEGPDSKLRQLLNERDTSIRCTRLKQMSLAAFGVKSTEVSNPTVSPVAQ